MPPAEASARTMMVQCSDVGVDVRRYDAEGDTGGAAEQSQQDGFGEELGADVAFGGSAGTQSRELRCIGSEGSPSTDRCFRALSRRSAGHVSSMIRRRVTAGTHESRARAAGTMSATGVPLTVKEISSPA